MRRLRIRSARWALLGLLSLAPSFPATPAAAQDSAKSASADEAEVEFRLGNEAYRAGHYERALAHYFASNRLVYNRNVIYNIARCYENLGRYVEAYRYYSTYLATVTEPDVRAEVEKAVGRMQRRVGILRIESEPAGATIYLNRTDLGSYGVTPLDVPVRPGEYQIILNHDGWVSRELEPIEVEAGARVEQRVELVRREGAVAFSGSPSQLEVAIGVDAEPIAIELPATLTVPIGPQVVVAQAPGHVSRRLTLEVREGELIEANVELERQTGTLVVTASELNSAVLLNGELIGFTPVVIPNVAVGPHRLSIVQEGFQAYAADVELSAEERLEVSATLVAVSEVAAASRVAEAVRDAPASVSLVSSREIDAFGYVGTADAILGLRGVYYTNDMTYQQIGVRGYGPLGQYGNRILVQLDGHTINDSWVEASYHQFELLSDIYGLERIEFVRGPNSLLYGSGAFQGVINLVSPDLDDSYRPSRVGVTAVSDGVLRAYAHYRHPFEDGGVQLSAGLAGGQGRDFFSPARFGSAEFPSGVAGSADGFDALTLRANAQWRSFRLYSHWHDRDQQIPTGAFETLFGDSRARQADRRGYLDLRYDDPRPASVKFNGRVYYDYYGFDGRYPYAEADGGLLRDDFSGHWGGAEGTVSLRPFKGARWSLGAEFERHFVHHATSSAQSGGLVFELSSPFTKTSANFMMRQEIGTTFSLLAGARYDLWLFDSLPTPEGDESARQIGSLNPRVVALARPYENGTIKIMGARGFRAPSVYELTYNDGGLTQIPNPALEPETIYSGEVEYTHGLPAGFELVGAFFTNRISTRVEQTGSGVEADPLQFVNVDETLWTAGAEIELRRPFLNGWMVSLNYAFARSREGAYDSIWSSQQPITNAPSHLAAAKFVAPIAHPSIQLANRLLFEGPRTDRAGNETRPAVVWDLMFSGQIANLPVRYAAGVRNLLDWRYEHPAGDEILDITLRQPGRTFLVDLSAQF